MAPPASVSAASRREPPPVHLFPTATPSGRGFHRSRTVLFLPTVMWRLFGADRKGLGLKIAVPGRSNYYHRLRVPYPVTFAAFNDTLDVAFGAGPRTVSYTDNDGDDVVLSTEAALAEAVHLTPEKAVLMLRVVAGQPGQPLAEAATPKGQAEKRGSASSGADEDALPASKRPRKEAVQARDAFFFVCRVPCYWVKGVEPLW